MLFVYYLHDNSNCYGVPFAIKLELSTRSKVYCTANADIVHCTDQYVVTGRKDGYLCVINMKTGQIEFAIEGHGSKGVLSMIANSPDDQVVSAGRGKDLASLSVLLCDFIILRKRVLLLCSPQQTVHGKEGTPAALADRSMFVV